MPRGVHRVCGAVIGVLIAAVAPAARGGVFEDVAFGLGQAGFDFQGQLNPFNLGADFTAQTRNTGGFTLFEGNTLDFGVWDLTLNGPVSFGVSTGQRGINTIDIFFKTARNDDPAQPLLYDVNFDVGPQSTTISGQTLIDGRLSLDGLGFYDLTLTVSSRQDITSDGALGASSTTSDLDIGPIDISGNIIADALSILFDPFFTDAGLTNPFDVLSGRAQLEDLFGAAADASGARVLSAGLADAPADRVFGPPPLDGLLGHGLGAGASGPGDGTAAAVPEPSTIIFVLLGGSLLVSARLRRQRCAR
ncbi:MAG: PEP-CTERM sorting domain-containing protein [Phycisphaerae bacterium]